MQTIRSFIAIPIIADIQRRVVRFIERLQNHDEGAVKWVPLDNLHLTLKFLGDVDNRMIPDVCRVMRQSSQGIGPFEVGFHGAGGFPDIDRARVLWVGVNIGNEILTPWVQTLEDQLAGLGFKREPRTYQAHLTIGRFKTGRRASPDLIDAVTTAYDQDFGSMLLQEAHLIASFMERKGPTYTVMDRLELKAD